MGAATQRERNWQYEFASALLDAGSPAPENLRAWNGSDPTARFAVYRNNVIVNLVDGLCATFPACLELVGEEFFRAMAGVFVRQHPPRTKILSEYGGDFPLFVAGFEPAREIPYLSGIAEIEAARVRAWHAADAESVSAADWQAIDPAILPQLRVQSHPSATIIESPFAVFSIWAAHQVDGEAELAGINVEAPEAVLVLRPELEVETMVLPPGGAQFFRAVKSGLPLGEAAASSQIDTPEFDLAANLGILMHSGFAVRLTSSHSQAEEG